MGRAAHRYAGNPGPYGDQGYGLVELGAADLEPLDEPVEDAATVVDRPLSEQITRPIPEPLPLRPPPRKALPSREALLAGTRRPASPPPSKTRWGVGVALVVASLWAVAALTLLAGVVAVGAMG